MKKIIKQLFSGCLILAFVCPSVNALAVGKQSNDFSMDEMDILIAAHYFLNSSDTENNFWVDSPSDIEIVPLYDQNGDVTLYYVEVEGGGYAVINNNTQNPTTVEFGAGSNPIIREILDNDVEPHIVYNSPLAIYNASDVTAMSVSVKHTGLYENYPDLKESDTVLATMLSKQKARLESSIGIAPYGDGDYGFIDWNQMPSGSYYSDDIPYGGIDWITTSEVSDIAKNHCGATAVTNLSLYFANRGYTKLKRATNRDTFIAVHDVVGNGPKMTIADDAKEYFSDCGYTLYYHTSKNFDNIKAATSKDRPCGILLVDGIVSWHWILSVGYRDYTSGDHYVRIVDGWNDTADRFYKLNNGSLWISATQYWM